MEITGSNLIQYQLKLLRDKLNDSATHVSDTKYLEKLMTEVNAVIEKLNKGIFGICEVCNTDIEDRYIKGDIFAKICLAHMTTEEQSNIEKDLELANRIQNKLLPSRHINANGWEIMYHYEPAGIVSGDVCDVIKSENGDDTYFLLGDVSGKGVSAAILMSHLNAIFRTIAGIDTELNEIVERANSLFCENTLSTHFATLVFGKAFPDGNVELCNAGHCFPYHLKDSKLIKIKSNGYPLGIFCDSKYELTKLHLEPGEMLFIYTDGLTETKNNSDEMFGEQKLEDILMTANKMEIDELFNCILKAHAVFRKDAALSDDMTLMTLKRLAP